MSSKVLWRTLLAVTNGLPLVVPALFGTSVMPQPVEAQELDRAYEVHVTDNVMVPMRDGVHLATDIYRPAANGQQLEGDWPVILFRIPYNKSRPNRVREAEYFARHGYIYVAQDTRGRFASEGVYHPFHREDGQNDGYDAVEWIAQQPWSDGKIGTVGVSYGGLTQLTLGSANPPSLDAQFIQVTQGNSYKSGFYNGGAFRLRRVGWLVGHAADSHEASRDPGLKSALLNIEDNLIPWLESFPVSFRPGATPLDELPEYGRDFLQGGIENSTYGEFWHDLVLVDEVDWDRYADVPVVNQGGWYDMHSTATPAHFLELVSRKQSPQRLIMGPWEHGGMARSYAGNADFGVDAAMDPDIFTLRLFDHWLKDVDNGVPNDPPVEVFVMGGGDGHKTSEGRIFHGGHWHESDQWPVRGTVGTNFYFHADGSLRDQPPTGETSPTAYIHDPADPVPTVGGTDSWIGWDEERQERVYGMSDGAYDQRDPIHGTRLSLRRDVVTFQTPPLEEAVEMVGPITVTLYASSSAVNTDFTAKLVDVYPHSSDWPGGYDFLVADGILRTTHRSGPRPTRLEALEPGREYTFTIAVPPSGNRFEEGHRIRVDIASSNFPRFDVNPGTMDGPWQRRRYIKAENKIYHDSQRPSHIILPVITHGSPKP